MARIWITFFALVFVACATTEEPRLPNRQIFYDFDPMTGQCFAETRLQGEWSHVPCTPRVVAAAKIRARMSVTQEPQQPQAPRAPSLSL